MIYFILSALLVAWTAYLARRIGNGPHDRAWFAIAAATLHLGAASIGSSLFGQYTPVGFLFVQLVLSILLFILIRWLPARASFELALSPPSRREIPVLILIAIAIIWFIGGVIVKQAMLPVGGFDERMYHASRAAYWMQNQSIFWWETHNQRQVVFPFGSEMIFAWPLMMTRSEPIARTIFVLALPLTACGVYSLARTLGAQRTTALLATLVLVATPTVFRRSAGLKPDMWCALYALGVAYWIVSTLGNRDRAKLAAAMVGIFFCLAVNVKTTMLVMTPVVALTPLFVRPVRKKTGWMLGGCAFALVFSGLLVTLTQNVIHTRHPLGSAPMRAVHTADLSPHQLYTHTCRLIVFLIEPPFIPSEELAGKWETSINGVIKTMDVQVLPVEAPNTWLEPFYVHGRPLAENFSFAGMLWLPLLLASSIAAIRKLRSEAANSHVLIVLLACSLLAVALVVRWMVGIDRFLLPAFAVSIPITLVNLEQWLRPSLRVMASMIFVMLMLIPSWLAQFTSLRDELTSDYSWVDEPFMEVIPRLLPESRIMLIASQDTRDYPLFLPRDGFANEVFTWGRSPIDLDVLQRRLEEQHATHLLIAGVPEVSFHWDAPVDTTPAVRWADAQPQWQPIPLDYTPNMRLFARQMRPLDPSSPVQ